MKVLIIEQDMTLGKSLSYFLEQHKSCEVHLARSRQEGLALLNAAQFTMVLCGDRLPDGDGLEILKTLRGQNPGVTSIFMTARNDEDLREAARQAGITGYLEKPFDLQQLEEVMSGAPPVISSIYKKRGG